MGSLKKISPFGLAVGRLDREHKYLCLLIIKIIVSWSLNVQYVIFFSRGLILLLCLSGAYAQFSRGTFQSSKKQDGGSSADQSQVNKIPELINT